MRALALLLALTGPALAASAPAREFTELPPGRYTIGVTGLVTTVCARAIAAEWAALPEVEAASVDFDKSTALVTVRLDSVLPVASLRKTLRRAERTANLGAHYDLRGISYRLGK
ncbi:MAG: cation transporter [Elusimicrobia bacterium]|nr:cation transporter [Elusimicrobiota bacterium]